MGNCQSMFSKDQNLIYDMILQNYSFLNSGWNKKALDFVCKGTYAGIRNNYGKFFDEEVSLQTGKWWWKVLFWGLSRRSTECGLETLKLISRVYPNLGTPSQTQFCWKKQASIASGIEVSWEVYLNFLQIYVSANVMLVGL